MLGLFIAFILILCGKCETIVGWMSIGSLELSIELSIFAVWLN